LGRNDPANISCKIRIDRYIQCRWIWPFLPGTAIKIFTFSRQTLLGWEA